MRVEVVPMLATQRDLLETPRGWARFSRYLAAMTGGTGEMVLPLPLFNPMAKGHVATFLDRLLALKAEDLAAKAAVEASERLSAFDLDFRLGLVVADDAQGGWTNRHLADAKHRFEQGPFVKRGWAVAVLWTSETPTAASVRAEVMSALFRAASVARRGSPKRLGDMMRQEGRAAAFAGQGFDIPPAEVDASRGVLRQHLDTQSFPTAFACLYGDGAAREAGYRPLGLAKHAGFAVAFADARASAMPPEVALAKER
jgi:hypothetical protein